MVNHSRRVDSVAWAWAAGWALASTGLAISDVYSSPNRGFAAAYILGFAGWAIGATGTIRRAREVGTADVHSVAMGAAGWGVGAVVAVVVGLVWLDEMSVQFWGPILGSALGAAIGGALTIPRQSPSSMGTVLRQSALGAFSWGVSFLLFQVLSFYAGYLLMQMTVDPLAPIIGHGLAKVPGWAIPAALGGFAAARLASSGLTLTEQAAV